MPEQEEWDLAKRVSAQQSILGASLDAHPLELLDTKLVASLSITSSRDVYNRIGETVRLLGIRQTLMRIQGIVGIPMYALELEDLDGVITILIPRELYTRQRTILRSHQPLIVEGVIEYEPKLGETVLLTQRVWPIQGQ